MRLRASTNQETQARSPLERLHVSYQKATPIDPPKSLRARTQEMTPKKTILVCSLESEGEQRAPAGVAIGRCRLRATGDRL